MLMFDEEGGLSQLTPLSAKLCAVLPSIRTHMAYTSMYLNPGVDVLSLTDVGTSAGAAAGTSAGAAAGSTAIVPARHRTTSTLAIARQPRLAPQTSPFVTVNPSHWKLLQRAIWFGSGIVGLTPTSGTRVNQVVKWDTDALVRSVSNEHKGAYNGKEGAPRLATSLRNCCIVKIDQSLATAALYGEKHGLSLNQVFGKLKPLEIEKLVYCFVTVLLYSHRYGVSGVCQEMYTSFLMEMCRPPVRGKQSDDFAVLWRACIFQPEESRFAELRSDMVNLLSVTPEDALSVLTAGGGPDPAQRFLDAGLMHVNVEVSRTGESDAVVKEGDWDFGASVIVDADTTLPQLQLREDHKEIFCVVAVIPGTSTQGVVYMQVTDRGKIVATPSNRESDFQSLWEYSGHTWTAIAPDDDPDDLLSEAVTVAIKDGRVIEIASTVDTVHGAMVKRAVRAVSGATLRITPAKVGVPVIVTGINHELFRRVWFVNEAWEWTRGCFVKDADGALTLECDVSGENTRFAYHNPMDVFQLMARGPDESSGPVSLYPIAVPIKTAIRLDPIIRPYPGVDRSVGVVIGDAGLGDLENRKRARRRAMDAIEDVDPGNVRALAKATQEYLVNADDATMLSAELHVYEDSLVHRTEDTKVSVANDVEYIGRPCSELVVHVPAAWLVEESEDRIPWIGRRQFLSVCMLAFRDLGSRTARQQRAFAGGLAYSMSKIPSGFPRTRAAVEVYCSAFISCALTRADKAINTDQDPVYNGRRHAYVTAMELDRDMGPKIRLLAQMLRAALGLPSTTPLVKGAYDEGVLLTHDYRLAAEAVVRLTHPRGTLLTKPELNQKVCGLLLLAHCTTDVGALSQARTWFEATNIDSRLRTPLYEVVGILLGDAEGSLNGESAGVLLALACVNPVALAIMDFDVAAPPSENSVWTLDHQNKAVRAFHSIKDETAAVLHVQPRLLQLAESIRGPDAKFVATGSAIRSNECLCRTQEIGGFVHYATYTGFIVAEMNPVNLPFLNQWPVYTNMVSAYVRRIRGAVHPFSAGAGADVGVVSRAMDTMIQAAHDVLLDTRDFTTNAESTVLNSMVGPNYVFMVAMAKVHAVDITLGPSPDCDEYVSAWLQWCRTLNMRCATIVMTGAVNVDYSLASLEAAYLEWYAPESLVVGVKPMGRAMLQGHGHWDRFRQELNVAMFGSNDALCTVEVNASENRASIKVGTSKVVGDGVIDTLGGEKEHPGEELPKAWFGKVSHVGKVLFDGAFDAKAARCPVAIFRYRVGDSMRLLFTTVDGGYARESTVLTVNANEKIKLEEGDHEISPTGNLIVEKLKGANVGVATFSGGEDAVVFRCWDAGASSHCSRWLVPDHQSSKGAPRDPKYLGPLTNTGYDDLFVSGSAGMNRTRSGQQKDENAYEVAMGVVNDRVQAGAQPDPPPDHVEWWKTLVPDDVSSHSANSLRLLDAVRTFCYACSSLESFTGYDPDVSRAKSAPVYATSNGVEGLVSVGRGAVDFMNRCVPDGRDGNIAFVPVDGRDEFRADFVACKSEVFRVDAMVFADRHGTKSGNDGIYFFRVNEPGKYEVSAMLEALAETPARLRKANIITRNARQIRDLAAIKRFPVDAVPRDLRALCSIDHSVRCYVFNMVIIGFLETMMPYTSAGVPSTRAPTSMLRRVVSRFGFSTASGPVDIPPAPEYLLDTNVRKYGLWTQVERTIGDACQAGEVILECTKNVVAWFHSPDEDSDGVKAICAVFLNLIHRLVVMGTLRNRSVKPPRASISTLDGELSEILSLDLPWVPSSEKATAFLARIANPANELPRFTLDHPEISRGDFSLSISNLKSRACRTDHDDDYSLEERIANVTGVLDGLGENVVEYLENKWFVRSVEKKEGDLAEARATFEREAGAYEEAHASAPLDMFSLTEPAPGELASRRAAEKEVARLTLELENLERDVPAKVAWLRWVCEAYGNVIAAAARLARDDYACLQASCLIGDVAGMYPPREGVIRFDEYGFPTVEPSGEFVQGKVCLIGGCDDKRNFGLLGGSEGVSVDVAKKQGIVPKPFNSSANHVGAYLDFLSETRMREVEDGDVHIRSDATPTDRAVISFVENFQPYCPPMTAKAERDALALVSITSP
jgi:hypothetical protein